VSDAPADFVDGLLKAIIGIEIPIASIVGKWKVSQNRGTADAEGVVAGLAARATAAGDAMAALVAERIAPDVRRD
jgi:transcriptional regulator